MAEIKINRETLTLILNTLKKRSKHGRVASYIALVIHQPGILTLYHNDDLVFSIVRLRIDPETVFPKETIFTISELLQCVSIGLNDDITIVMKEGDSYFLLDTGVLFLSTYNMDLDMFVPPDAVKRDARISHKLMLDREDFLLKIDRLKNVLKVSDNILFGGLDSVWTYKSDLRVDMDMEFVPVNLHAQDLLMLKMFPSSSFSISYGDTYACLQDENNSMYVFIPLRSAVYQKYNLDSEIISVYRYVSLRVHQVLLHGTSFVNDSGMVQLTGDSKQVRCRLLNSQFKKNSLLVLTEEVDHSAERVIQFFTEVDNLLSGLSVFKGDEESLLVFRKDCLIIRNQEDSIRVTILNRNLGTWL